MLNAKEKIRGLYAIVDNTFTPNLSHVELASRLLVGGCKLLQLRMKRVNSQPSTVNCLRAFTEWDGTVFDIAKQIIDLKKRFDFTFIINDYVDVAAELRADGVHVGENDMAVEEIKSRVGDRLLVGYSSHSIDEAIAAGKRGADYVALGAIFPTKTKGPGHPVQGLDKLHFVAEHAKIPVVAIGGINRSNVAKVLEAGASSIAMITGLTQAEDIVTETKYYVDMFNNSRS